MSKAVMISIQPKWCELIASGYKTVEVRKTRPKIETPFKCYIYCTKKKDFILDGEPDWGGKVIVEFVCDYIDKDCIGEFTDYFEQCGCIERSDLIKYAGNKTIYGWHISNLVIYGKPKALSEFHYPPERFCEKEKCAGCPLDCSPTEAGDYLYDCDWKRPITRPPQSWCYVEELK